MCTRYFNTIRLLRSSAEQQLIERSACSTNSITSRSALPDNTQVAEVLDLRRIAGAGPTGLTAAVELVRRGKKVRIIETKKGRSVYSKALGVNPCSLELLEASGVTKAMLKAGQPPSNLP